MTPEDLKAKYGKSKNGRRLVNAAIRAELPGGNEALDALDKLHDAGGQPLALVRRIVDHMAEEIRRRYGLPLRDDPGDDAS